MKVVYLLGESGLANRVAKLLTAFSAAFHGLIVGLGPASGPALLESRLFTSCIWTVYALLRFYWHCRIL